MKLLLVSRAVLLQLLRILATLALMVVCGVVTFVTALTFLMNLGTKLHDNYKYYGSFPAVLLLYGVGIIGFITPGLIIWYLRNKEPPWQFSVRILFVLITLIAVLLRIYMASI